MSDPSPERTPTTTEPSPAPASADAAPPPTVEGGTLPEVAPSLAAQAIGVLALQVPGYEILGELGRGGMGAVFKGRDPELGRELAVKVLLERHHDNARTVERFLEEAQVGGQLQHPGVVPVYESGRLPDNRPYFTMKLVEGRTLAALLKERDTPARDLPRFLTIFEQICQTLAYAHSKGVIHRDLKPANVMIGAFGELQVMDWGLAKVVRGRGVRTVRSETAEAESAAGSVVGTPAYMAPEQACGDVDGLDERCDVFGLGAMLCEILTGAPPYRGRETGELLRKAARADLTDAFVRLDGCGADAELVGLAKACLAAEPAERPRDGRAAAGAMTAHLAGVQERLRKAELERAAAQARAEAALAKTRAERRARRMTVALAATLLLALTAAGAGTLWYQQDRAARAAADARQAAEHARKAAATERDVTAALEDATAFGKQATGLHDDPAKWEAALVEALSAVKRAEGVLNSGVDDTGQLRPRVDAARAELESADRDRRMVARLEEARFQEAAAGQNGFDAAGAVSLYAAAFRQDDKGWDSLETDEAAAHINQRAIREDLLAALSEWAFLTSNKDEADRLHRIAQATDPDPGSFRNRCELLLDQKDWAGLRRLALGPEAGDVPAVRLAQLGRQLLDHEGAAPEAVKFFEEANERRPGDFWIAFELARAYSTKWPPETDESIRYFTAALMVRPNSAVAHNNVGFALYNKGRTDAAIDEFRRALQIQPKVALFHSNLGAALYAKGHADAAIEEYKKALEIQPDFALAHLDLGAALNAKGHADAAIEEYKKALATQPDLAEAHVDLGAALYATGQVDPAIEEFRNAIRAQPNLASAHDDLGIALTHKGRVEDALVEYQKAMRIQPDNFLPIYNAACTAARAGCGQGEGAVHADEKQRGLWRKQAVGWMRASLNLWTKKLDGGNPDDRAATAAALQFCQADSDLACVRDADALAKLPADEQDAWRKLWADVDARLKMAQEK